MSTNGAPGRHALVTGGSSGIGKATATLLGAKGWRVTLVARGQARLDEAKSEVEAAGAPAVLAVSADVSNAAEAAGAVERATAELGAPDLVITSAGVAHPGYFEELPLEVFERTMAINYFGSLYTIKAAVPAMLERGRGHVVLVSSAVALVGVFGYAPYAPTKHAVRGLAEVLRAELKPRGIKVSCVYPPDTDTPQLAEENKTKPIETKRINETGGLMSPQAVAAEIVRGVERGRFTIAPGMEMKLLAPLQSVAAPVLGWYFDRIIAKARQTRA